MAITATAIATYVTVPEKPTVSVEVTCVVTIDVCVTAWAVTVLVTDDVAVVVVTAVVTFVTAWAVTVLVTVFVVDLVIVVLDVVVKVEVDVFVHEI